MASPVPHPPAPLGLIIALGAEHGGVLNRGAGTTINPSLAYGPELEVCTSAFFLLLSFAPSLNFDRTWHVLK